MNRRKKLLLCLGVSVCFIVGGCKVVDQAVSDPNSGLNETISIVENVSDAATIVAPVAGPLAGPWGWLVGGVATVLSSSLAAYKSYQKNLEVSRGEAVKKTTAAIVKAVDTVGNLEGPDNKKIVDLVKKLVKENLEKSGISAEVTNSYVIGKNIIEGLKES